MTRFFTSRALGTILHNIGGYHSYALRSMSILNKQAKISFIPIETQMDEKRIKAYLQNLPGRKNLVTDIPTPVMQVVIPDIVANDGEIIVALKTGGTIEYGDYGILPSRSSAPQDLLKYKLELPSNSFGVIKAMPHTPFSIRGDGIFLPLCKLEKVLPLAENIKKYSLDKVCSLSWENAKRLTVAIQDKIFNSNSSERFFEEVTDVVSKPTEYMPTSATLMNFEATQLGEDKSTNMHYHPGDRSLHIITTEKRAGVTLNFCGVAENPINRPDSQVVLQFPMNSILILNFPHFTHHKFHGEFVCNSVHPQEGEKFMEFFQSGKLPAGFLESNTVFSRTENDPEKWNNDISENLKKPHDYGYSR